jgi:hypothetical protein
MVPFWCGKNAKTLFFRGDDKVELDDMSITIKRYGTKAEDGVNGEPRNRRQFITDGYEITVEGKQQKLALLATFVAEQQALDTNTVEVPKAMGVLVQQNDGTSSSFQLTKLTLDDWEMNWKGRAERNSYTLPMRADDVEMLPSL